MDLIQAHLFRKYPQLFIVYNMYNSSLCVQFKDNTVFAAKTRQNCHFEKLISTEIMLIKQLNSIAQRKRKSTVPVEVTAKFNISHFVRRNSFLRHKSGSKTLRERKDWSQ